MSRGYPRPLGGIHLGEGILCRSYMNEKCRDNFFQKKIPEKKSEKVKINLINNVLFMVQYLVQKIRNSLYYFVSP